MAVEGVAADGLPFQRPVRERLYQAVGEPLGGIDELELTGVTGPREIEVHFRANQFAQWSAALPEGQRGPLATPHGDNITNVMRYAFGAGPQDSVVVRMPRPVYEPRDGSGDRRLGLEFWRRKDASDIRYGIQFSNDLHLWLPTWAIEYLDHEILEDDGTSERLRVWEPAGNDGGSRFIRLKVDWLGQ